MLEDFNISCGHSRNSKPHRLPKRKVPWHNSCHHTYWFKAHKAFTKFSWNQFIAEKCFSRFGVIVTQPCAFFDFCSCLADRFTHFFCDEFSIFTFVSSHYSAQISSEAASLADVEIFPTLRAERAFLTFSLI